jgi:hypothetical protein
MSLSASLHTEFLFLVREIHNFPDFGFSRFPQSFQKFRDPADTSACYPRPSCQQYILTMFFRKNPCDASLLDACSFWASNRQVLGHGIRLAVLPATSRRVEHVICIFRPTDDSQKKDT